MESFGRKSLAGALGLGVALCLLGLLVATGESIRQAEIASLLPEAAEPGLPIKQEPVDSTYRDPALAAWMTP
ncbi:MAG: hypothetical protein HYR50_09740 [Candidatus Rokubacteria bacterium]|nr:hypothetical protein [Candidatus Rokubacteria bacterium]